MASSLIIYAGRDGREANEKTKKYFRKQTGLEATEQITDRKWVWEGNEGIQGCVELRTVEQHRGENLEDGR